MIISWLGQNCFKIQDKGITIVTDPYGSETGLKLPLLRADVVLLSDPDSQANSLVKPMGRSDSQDAGTEPESEVFLISMPGEYEIRETFVYGIMSKSKGDRANIIYKVELDGVSIVFLGALDQPLSDKQIEKISKVDILIVPVGGNGALDAKKAVEAVNQIEPLIVIPSFFKVPNLKPSLDPVDKFYQEMGMKPEAPVDKLKISKKDLLQQEGARIIAFKI